MYFAVKFVSAFACFCRSRFLLGVGICVILVLWFAITPSFAQQNACCEGSACGDPLQNPPTEYDNNVRIALIFGNNQYMGVGVKPLPNLDNAVADATFLSARLRGLGYGVRCVLNAQFQQGQSEIKAAAQRIAKIKEHIERFPATASDARFLLYFAGHGAVDKQAVASSGRNVVFFSGRKKDGNFTCVKELSGVCFDPFWSSMLIDWLVREVTQHEGIVPIVLIDACRAELNLGDRYVNGPDRAQEPRQPKPHLLIYSTHSGGLASDREKRFMTFFGDHIGAAGNGREISFGKTFFWIYETARYYMEKGAATQNPDIWSDIPDPSHEIFHWPSGVAQACPRAAHGLWALIKRVGCKWDSESCVKHPCDCADWSDAQKRFHAGSGTLQQCWGRYFDPLFSGYFKSCPAKPDCPERAISSIVANATSRIVSAQGFATERGQRILATSLSNAKLAFVARVDPSERKLVPPSSGRSAVPIDAMVRDLTPDMINSFVRTIDLNALGALGREHGQEQIAWLISDLEPETLNGLVRKLYRTTINEFIQKHSLETIGTLARQQVGPRALGVLIDKLDVETLSFVAGQLDQNASRKIVDHLEKTYVDQIRPATPAEVQGPEFAAIFRHERGSQTAAGSSKAAAPEMELAPLPAADIVVSRRQLPLRQLPWASAPAVQVGGKEILLQTGRSYARDCETLQCSSTWTGVRAKAADGTTVRGFVPRASLDLMPPMQIETITYVGDNIVPDKVSLERLRKAFRRLKAAASPHVRITTRIDGIASTEARSLAGARAAVLVEMFRQEGITRERLSWRDHVASADANFPGAIVEIQRPADG